MLVSRRALLAACGAPAVLAQRRSTEPRANIVLILAGDLGAWLLGSYGNREIRTPNLDLLARSGSRLASHSVATLGTAAGVATLLTGRLPRQHRVPEAPGKPGLPATFANEVLISDLLAAAGYECGFAGRWELGDPTKAQRGFRSWSALPADERGSALDPVTESAVRFLEERKPGQPFFLLVSHGSPCAPYDGLPQKYYDRYANSTFESVGWLPAAANAAADREMMADPVGSLRKCAAAISALDDQIPPLVSVLDRKGLRDNTVIVFTATRGLPAGRHGVWSGGRGSNPVNLYAEAIETPMIWNRPGTIPVEATRMELAGSYDLFPTLCEVAGVTAPKGRNLCGRSYLLPLTNRPLPRREPPWRNLVFASYEGAEMARDSRIKLVLRGNGAGPNELYDLRIDPRETTNLYDDDRFVTVRNNLSNSLSQWREKYV
ncbi:MAG: sulfatase-like hydrolase/transferase [Bryobacterales bacterium]|nr:sulfatase-like hydrolase/transferase [Bryobacterales bacterium]